jgi:hypothetical protein
VCCCWAGLVFMPTGCKQKCCTFKNERQAGQVWER